MGVWLRYTPAGPAALAGASLRVRAGTSMGVCGRTGSGKSTLVAALVRLAETSAGSITIAIGEEAGQAADAIATHLRFAAIGVKDAHAQLTARLAG